MLDYMALPAMSAMVKPRSNIVYVVPVTGKSADLAAFVASILHAEQVAQRCCWVNTFGGSRGGTEIRDAIIRARCQLSVMLLTAWSAEYCHPRHTRDCHGSWEQHGSCGAAARGGKNSFGCQG